MIDLSEYRELAKIDNTGASGFEHPCQQTCSGWKQGRDRGRFESKQAIERLCDALEKCEQQRNAWIDKAFDGYMRGASDPDDAELNAILKGKE